MEIYLGKAEKPWWDIESEFPYTSVSRVDLLGFSCKQLRCSYGTFTLVGQAWKPWFTRSGCQIASRVPQWRCDQLCQGGQREAILWWNYYSLVAGAGALEVKKRSGVHFMKQGETMGKDGESGSMWTTLPWGELWWARLFLQYLTSGRVIVRPQCELTFKSHFSMSVTSFSYTLILTRYILHNYAIRCYIMLLLEGLQSLNSFSIFERLVGPWSWWVAYYLQRVATFFLTAIYICHRICAAAAAPMPRDACQ